MKSVKKLIGVATLMTFLASAGGLNAAINGEDYDNYYGYGYEQSRRSSIDPKYPLGALAVLAVVAVLWHNSSGHHHHSH